MENIAKLEMEFIVLLSGNIMIVSIFINIVLTNNIRIIYLIVEIEIKNG